MSETALVGLGSNLGSPLATLREARRDLAELGTVTRASALYRTAPVGGPAGQNDYLNAVIALEPSPAFGEPLELLRALLEIEGRHGRLRRIRWAARTLDLDLLAFGQRIVDEPGLTLPHPRLARRAFVLAPLCEVAPQWRHPLGGESACELLAEVDMTGVTRTDLDWSGGGESG